MQEIANREFLDLAEDRSLPLDEMATKRSDQGVEFPNDILADIRLTLDPTLGQSVFISSVLISENLISITLTATDELQFSPGNLVGEAYGSNTYSDTWNSPFFNGPQDEDFLGGTSPTFATNTAGSISPIIPIAVVTATLKETAEGKPIRIEPIVDGVSGWVVFGRELHNHTGSVWAFSSVSQSSVSRRSVHFLNFSRVKTLGRAGEQIGISGVVTIDGESGIGVTRTLDQSLYVPTTLINPYNMSRDTINIGFTGSLTKERLKKYAGPCGVRPDSASCLRGQPIRSINSVRPVLNNDTYTGSLFLIFPEELFPYVFAWHRVFDDNADEDMGLILSSEDISIKSVCPPPFSEVDGDGVIGNPSVCCPDCPDCPDDCHSGAGVADTVQALYDDTTVDPSHIHICLGTNVMTVHEYITDINGVSRTHLVYVGTIEGDHVYAENVNDLGAGLVVYVDGTTGKFIIHENGSQMVGILGFMRSDACRSKDIIYRDSNAYTVIMTIAQQSIFVSTAASVSDPHIPVIDMLYAGGGSSTIADPSAYLCEQKYGTYADSTTSKYRLQVNPYADPLNIGANKYPYTLYYVDEAEGVHQELVSGNFEVTSVAQNNSSGAAKPVPRLDSGTVSFTYKGNTYTGTIYSNVESSGGC